MIIKWDGLSTIKLIDVRALVDDKANDSISYRILVYHVIYVIF